MKGNPWPFLRIAHRGAAGLEPENTLRAIEAALRLGVEMVEIDTRPCADGTLLVVHDNDLSRVAGVKQRVSESTRNQLRSIDVGKGEQIPSLDEVLDLLRGRALVNIDQKLDDLAPQLLAVIDRVSRREEIMLSGHAARTFAQMRALAPEVRLSRSLGARWRGKPRRLLARRTAAGARGEAGRIIARGRTAQADALTLDYRLASPRVTAYCQRAGFAVLVWTVDDIPTMRALRAAGVDGITSNRPDLLMQV
ncbi:MAG TPA: glycerophosphodiester phosphodiesterase [Chloroflexota bacterium]|nr:glycerophosphodiester phosphodiesterase [Chloroflexota bacterium]